MNCTVVGPRAADLKIALVRDFEPGGMLAGGTTGTFTYATGPRAAIGNGFHQTYFLDVSYKAGGSAVFPIPFGVQCKSGNGMMDPYLLGTVAPLTAICSARPPGHWSGRVACPADREGAIIDVLHVDRR